MHTHTTLRATGHWTRDLAVTALVACNACHDGLSEQGLTVGCYGRVAHHLLQHSPSASVALEHSVPSSVEAGVARQRSPE